MLKSCLPRSYFPQTRSILRLQPRLYTMSALDANQNGDATKKTYSKKTTGAAAATAEAHSAERELKLYGSCFWYVRKYSP